MKVASIVPWRRHTALAGRRRLPFPSIFDEVDRLFDDIAGVPSASAPQFAPRVDVRESADAIVVRADLPGLTAEDFEVEVAESVLTIRGERPSEDADETNGRHWTERLHGRFERSVRLPQHARVDDATATHDKGVLTIHVPKAPDPATRAHKISVTSA